MSKKPLSSYRARGALGGRPKQKADPKQHKACTRCRRQHYPRRGDSQWMFDKRQWCGKEDCRAHAIKVGAIKVRKYAKSRYDKPQVPDIPCPQHWGFVV